MPQIATIPKAPTETVLVLRVQNSLMRLIALRQAIRLLTSLSLFEVSSGRLLRRLGEPQHTFWAIAFNPQASKLVFSGDDACQLGVWGSSDGSTVFTSERLGTR
jgi:hypothetical protein